MKTLLYLFGIVTLIIVSCSKAPRIVTTFKGILPIVSAKSPTTVIVGQNIISNVRCELTSLSGSVYFQNFDVTEISAREFNITAIALYKDWNTQTNLPVIWILDTTATIKTTMAGQCILNFYNANSLFKSDTIEVN